MKHILYIGVGLGLMVLVIYGIILIVYLSKALWSLYMSEYFFAVNRTLLTATIIGVCWVIGREVVVSRRNIQ